ncbi:hypothetical protein BISA_1350 [Bifidobacterium saguini DSM 23967]|uniref:Uncharacterized protein n=1 Tax=Bifidobacterium saguini DSM 23967 TaxID=1437607 RepID=A0A087DCD5_9BIFI|nr:hypothetical protein [Bifidobacterium saguini]KFI93185.1 hypothetical protein BISA_1350 [Bifidobacterium saguini DSM 23967]
MSERVLWIRLYVTGPTPSSGEVVGLRIENRQIHRVLFDAFFRPSAEREWDMLPTENGVVDLRDRLHISIYITPIELILSQATIIRGDCVERDLMFLQAAGIHIEKPVVARSIQAEHRRRLAQGIAVPAHTQELDCRPIPGALETIQ